MKGKHMALRETPVMIEGMRGPADARKRYEAEFKAKYIPIQPDDYITPEQGTVYQSRHRRYRIQVTTVPDTKYADTGRLVPGKSIVAKFDEYFWVNREVDPEKRKMIDDALQSNPWFGSNKDFWLAAEKRKTDDAARIESAKESFKRNPEALKALIDELRAGGEDFSLPERRVE